MYMLLQHMKKNKDRFLTEIAKKRVARGEKLEE